MFEKTVENMIRVRDACEHLSAATRLLLEAGISEHSPMVVDIRRTNGTILFHMDSLKVRNKSDFLAEALDATFPE